MAIDEHSYESLLRESERTGTERGSVDSRGCGDIEKIDYDRSISKTSRVSLRSPLLVHVTVLLLYTAIFTTALWHVWSRPAAVESDTNIVSPLNAAIRRAVRTVNYNFEATSKFKGPSVEDVAKEWTATLNQPHNLRVHPSQMTAANLSSIRLSDGSGDYIVQPVAYHMLHCLYTLYRYAHPEFYGEDPAGPAWVVEHTEHCIENLRQFVLCHAGAGASTFRWLESRKIPWPVLDTEETCIDWQYFDDWVQEHSVDMEELVNLETEDGRPMLTHPTLGPVTAADYSEKRGSKENGPHMLPPEIAAELNS